MSLPRFTLDELQDRIALDVGRNVCAGLSAPESLAMAARLNPRCRTRSHLYDGHWVHRREREGERRDLLAYFHARHDDRVPW